MKGGIRVLKSGYDAYSFSIKLRNREQKTRFNMIIFIKNTRTRSVVLFINFWPVLRSIIFSISPFAVSLSIGRRHTPNWAPKLDFSGSNCADNCREAKQKSKGKIFSYVYFSILLTYSIMKSSILIDLPFPEKTISPAKDRGASPVNCTIFFGFHSVCLSNKKIFHWEDRYWVTTRSDAKS